MTFVRRGERHPNWTCAVPSQRKFCTVKGCGLISLHLFLRQGSRCAHAIRPDCPPSPTVRAPSRREPCASTCGINLLLRCHSRAWEPVSVANPLDCHRNCPTPKRKWRFGTSSGCGPAQHSKGGNKGGYVAATKQEGVRHCDANLRQKMWIQKWEGDVLRHPKKKPGFLDSLILVSGGRAHGVIEDS